MSRKADPLTPVRQERFRAYCQGKGWRNPDGTWNITAVQMATGKPRNKVSDLLNNKGSFGAAIARDIEDALPDMNRFYLDGADSSAPGTAPPPRDPWPQSVSLAAAIEAMSAHLETLSPLGRELAATLLVSLARSPDTADNVCASLEAIHKLHGNSATGHKAAAKTKQYDAALRADPRIARLRVEVHPAPTRQMRLPLTTVADPFNTDLAPQRELEWYQSIQGKRQT